MLVPDANGQWERALDHPHERLQFDPERAVVKGRTHLEVEVPKHFGEKQAHLQQRQTLAHAPVLTHAERNECLGVVVPRRVAFLVIPPFGNEVVRIGKVSRITLHRRRVGRHLFTGVSLS